VRVRGAMLHDPNQNQNVELGSVVCACFFVRKIFSKGFLQYQTQNFNLDEGANVRVGVSAIQDRTGKKVSVYRGRDSIGTGSAT